MADSIKFPGRAVIPAKQKGTPRSTPAQLLADVPLPIAAADHSIDELSENLSEVGRRLSFPPSHVVAKKQTGASQLGDSGLKAHTGSQTWFFEQQREYLTLQDRGAIARCETRFQDVCRAKHRTKFAARNVK